MMPMSGNDYYVNIDEIVLAHKYSFSNGGFCDYSGGRLYCGFMYAIKGNATYKLKNGSSYNVFEGEVAFIPDGLAYVISSDDTYEHFTVNFKVNKEKCYGDNIFEMLSSNNMIKLAPSSPNKYITFFSQIADAWQKKDIGYRMNTVSMLYRLINDFISEKYACGVDVVSYSKILPAKEYLDKHYNNTISIDMLANISNMSHTNFRRTFHLVFGKTAMEYKNDILLLHAGDMLSDNLYSIREIAEICGFADANYFSRFFKKHMGITPTQYKLQYING